MSADGSLDLQKAIVTALKVAAPAIAGGRVYDAVPPGASYPYVSYGGEQALQDDFECIRGQEIFVTLDVWSRAVGKPEMKQIVGAVLDVLHEAELTLDDHALVLLEHDQTRYLDDPDQLTSHGVMTFRALVEAA